VKITVAATALMALTVGVYAFLDLRADAARRHRDIETDARELAMTLRASIEARGVVDVLLEANDVSEAISRAGTPWSAAILPRSLATHPVPAAETRQVERLKTILEVRLPELIDDEGDHYVLAVPLRVPSLKSPEGFEIAGSLEVSRSTANLGPAFRADLLRTIPLLILIVGTTGLAVWGLTRSLVSRPIEKLVGGIDEVAKGDLTGVLLAEREDEIGMLAARYTEMTGSLREYRAETKRQNQARLQLEHRLSHTEKLATIGQIAAEIAHEVGTPLNVISGRAKSLGRKVDNPEAVQKNARIIAEQTDRIARIIQRLLDFTRRTVGATGKQRVNMNEVALVTMDFLEGQFASANVKTTLARAEGLPLVEGEPDKLQQVLLNVVLNAIQAMPKGGSLRVETSRVTRRRPGLEMAPEQDLVLVEVTDTGEGIKPDEREKIFEPFYTSKEDKGGTGLGLAVSHGIVKEHDGWMEVSTPEERVAGRGENDGARNGGTGPGTTVRIYLPVSPPKNATED